MADTIGQQDILSLDIEKTVKGFALTEYVFKSAVTVTSTQADNIRWYQETAADLTATSPMRVANHAFGASATNLEPSWTRNTSYIQEFMAEGTLAEMDVLSTDINPLARTLLRLTRAVVKQVDAHIWDVMTENRSVVNINSITSNAAWDAGAGQDPIEDILDAMKSIEENDYDINGLEVWLSPKDKKTLLTWLISTKGGSIPRFASEKVETGVLMELLGARVRVSNNVTADYAVVANPKKAVTFYQHTDTTSRIMENAGINRVVRVWERGLAVLTDPKAVSLISNTQT